MQRPDLLLNDVGEFSLHSEPLKRLFKLKKISNPFHPRNSSDLRGYVASWSLRTGGLYLSNINGYTNNRDFLSIIHSLRERELFFQWYSGPLYIPVGQIIDDGYFGLSSKYEVSSVANGIQVNSFVVDIQTTKLNQVMTQKIDAFDFTHRTIKTLLSNKIEYIGDLIMVSDEALFKMHNMGRKSFNEIRNITNNHDEFNSWAEKIVWDEYRQNPLR